ncbi:MAG: CorA family divalent cation transporter [Thermoprotei archaeon]
MKCEIQYVKQLPENFPKEELDAYRVEQSADGPVYIRFDLHRQPHYLELEADRAVVYTEYLREVLDKLDFPECSRTVILQELVYQFATVLNAERSTLLSQFEALLDEISEGRLSDTSKIRVMRKKAADLYSDTLSLYHVTRRLSKLLEQDALADVEFSLSRAESLLTRTSDLYNIYLTEVQNELNVVIKKLTSISFIFLPITAIASIYAVSFQSVPASLANTSALEYITPLVALGVLLTFYLKKIKWL